MGEQRQPLVLLVTPDSAVRGSLCTLLPLGGWRVRDVSTVALAVHNLKAALPDVLLVDQKLPDGEVLDVVRSLRARPGHQRVRVGVLVEAIDRETAVSYVRAGIDLFFAKPLALIEVAARLAEGTPGATPLTAPVPNDDPLARGSVVIVSPSLNVKDVAEKAIGDEFDVVLFDGARGIDAASRSGAVCMIVDEAAPGGLEGASTWRAIFGDAPMYALTSRGNEALPGFVDALTKPLRDVALQASARVSAERLRVAVFPMQGGIVARIRDGWHKQDDEAFALIIADLERLARQVKQTGRRWLCIDGKHLGSTDHLERTTRLVKAATLEPLHVGFVTNHSDPAFLSRLTGVPQMYIHASSALFIKTAQELV